MTETALHPLEDLPVRKFLRLARVAHLATADASGSPHNIPVCFWFDDEAHFYFVVAGLRPGAWRRLYRGGSRRVSARAAKSARQVSAVSRDGPQSREESDRA